MNAILFLRLGRLNGTRFLLLAALVLGLADLPARGFSLLGPFTDWMTETNGYSPAAQIGGPMDAGEEYRWNVPVVTYGFDKSFLDYFGSNGVAAVESAIRLLNDVPSASEIVLTNYPLSAKQQNFVAASEGLYDLKTMTLGLLLEQLGLAPPRKGLFVLRQWDPLFLDFPSESFWPTGTIPNLILERNFDPETAMPSHSINGTLFSASVYHFDFPSQLNGISTFPIDPFADPDTATLDVVNNFAPGAYLTGLSQDDIGGLRYLFSPDNVNYETLLPDIHRTRSHRLDGAWRPGIGKIMFVPQPVNRHGIFKHLVNKFTDTYLTTNGPVQQTVKRLIKQPDFLFCVADTGETNLFPPNVVRTGTENWINNSVLNGNTNNAGPGVIQPPIRITFNKRGSRVVTGGLLSEAAIAPESWGSYDNSTNPPIVYPPAESVSELVVRLHVQGTNYVEITNQVWRINMPAGAGAALMISTNGSEWSSLGTILNSGAVIEWYHYLPDDVVPMFSVSPAP